MAIIEVVSDEPSRSVDDLLLAVRQLAARLALPEELLHEHLDDKDGLFEPSRRQAEVVLRDLHGLIGQPEWEEVDEGERARVVFDVLRYAGDEPWSSPGIRQTVDAIADAQPTPVHTHILSQLVRPLFSPHPSVDPSSSRARARVPAHALADLSEAPQPFKHPSAWGAHLVLGAAAARAVADPASLPLVVPPTLVLMDDHDPVFRDRGAAALSAWLPRADPAALGRAGIDALLRAALLHSLALHPAEPMRRVLPPLLDLASRQPPAGRAETYAAIVDRAVLGAWTYAPAGAAGRPALVAAARHLAALAGVLGTGLARWLQPIVGGLLEPLQYPPAPAACALVAANLEALLGVLAALRGTGRPARWRGRILDVLARLWVQTHERVAMEEDDDVRELYGEVRRLVRDVYREIEQQCPQVQEAEFKQLLALDAKLFAPLVAPAGA